jgi:hypothetical protein
MTLDFIHIEFIKTFIFWRLHFHLFGEQKTTECVPFGVLLQSSSTKGIYTEDRLQEVMGRFYSQDRKKKTLSNRNHLWEIRYSHFIL